MLARLFKSEVLDPDRPPPGVHREEWALYVPRERRHRTMVRTLLALLLLGPLAWLGWRLAHPPATAPVHQASAAQLFERGNARAALVEIKAALNEAPELADARYLAGRIHLHMGAYAEAVKELTKARELGATAPELDIALATALMRDGQAQRLPGLLESSPLRSRKPADWHALSGAAQRLLGNSVLAEREFRAALARDPQNARALRGLARLALDAGAIAEAKARSDHAIDAERRHEDNWQLRGDVELAAGEAALAETAYRAALDLNPFRREAHTGLARALLAQNELELAAAEIKTINELAPREADTAFLRGELALRRNDPATATDAWQQALKLAPEHGETQLGLGRLFIRRGRYEQAMELLGRYVESHPQDVPAVRDFARLAVAVDAPARALAALSAIPRQVLDDPELVALLGTATLDMPGVVNTALIEPLLAAHAAP